MSLAFLCCAARAANCDLSVLFSPSSTRGRGSIVTTLLLLLLLCAILCKQQQLSIEKNDCNCNFYYRHAFVIYWERLCLFKHISFFTLRQHPGTRSFYERLVQSKHLVVLIVRIDLQLCFDSFRFDIYCCPVRTKIITGTGFKFRKFVIIISVAELVYDLLLLLLKV